MEDDDDDDDVDDEEVVELLPGSKSIKASHTSERDDDVYGKTLRCVSRNNAVIDSFGQDVGEEDISNNSE